MNESPEWLRTLAQAVAAFLLVCVSFFAGAVILAAALWFVMAALGN